MTGSAMSTETDGSTVNCVLNLFFELDPEPQRLPGTLVYEGTHGGDIQRTVLDAQGNGISLWPDVYGDVIVRSISPDQIQIAIPVNAGTESRFWRELSDFRGHFVSATTASGTWNCAPFDIDEGGYVDKKYTAQGTWTIQPTP